MKKRGIDISIYILAVFFDSFGVALMLKTGFGSMPFGMFSYNLALIIPLSIGVISFIYEILCVVGAGQIGRKKYQWSMVIYSFLFAFALELHLLYLPSFASSDVAYKVLLSLIAVAMLDVSKALFNVTVFPKLSVVALIYAISERFNLSLQVVTKGYNGFNLIGAIVFSFIAGQPFLNVGIGTLIYFILAGSILNYISNPIESWYNRVVMGRKTEVEHDRHWENGTSVSVNG